MLSRAYWTTKGIQYKDGLLVIVEHYNEIFILVTRYVSNVAKRSIIMTYV